LNKGHYRDDVTRSDEGHAPDQDIKPKFKDVYRSFGPRKPIAGRSIWKVADHSEDADEESRRTVETDRWGIAGPLDGPAVGRPAAGTAGIPAADKAEQSALRLAWIFITHLTRRSVVVSLGVGI
jgi:hypothetical protein